MEKGVVRPPSCHCTAMLQRAQAPWTDVDGRSAGRECREGPAVVAGAPRAVKVDFLRGTSTCVRIFREKVV